jgi:hypothetical protein
VRYDGPAYRVIRTFLRENLWPDRLSVAIVSAKYGLIGGLAPIPTYDRRLTAHRAAMLNPQVTQELCRLAANHSMVDLVLGRDYLEAVNLGTLRPHSTVKRADGAIGKKLHYLHDLLRSMPRRKREPLTPNVRSGRPMYFLPDWDDFVDAKFDFRKDKFSSDSRAHRSEAHTLALTRPQRLADGVLVSLAQNLGSKGLLRRVREADALHPRLVRDHFRLESDQFAFGDCGAFSYSGEDEPSITVPQAVAVYDLHGFDLGASVDHIPLEQVRTSKGSRSLRKQERERRVAITTRNAARFIDEVERRQARFTPVGVIQGLSPSDYSRQVPLYSEMGYTHIALGGLVPLADDAVIQIVREVSSSCRRLSRRPWLHLFGVFRPKLQAAFRLLGVDSFDSATYFRKSWLRSDQNYLSSTGAWYAAIRVPPLEDPRTKKRLLDSGHTESALARLERGALDALREFDSGTLAVDACLEAVLAYDRLLLRAEDLDERLIAAYRRTLEDRPWTTCHCAVCAALGIDVLVFRGLNRNKRRGAHNTLMLYRSLDRGS